MISRCKSKHYVSTSRAAVCLILSCRLKRLAFSDAHVLLQHNFSSQTALQARFAPSKSPEEVPSMAIPEDRFKLSPEEELFHQWKSYAGCKYPNRRSGEKETWLELRPNKSGDGFTLGCKLCSNPTLISKAKRSKGKSLINSNWTAATERKKSMPKCLMSTMAARHIKLH